jgi:FkbM family methyltransferase
MSSLGLRRLHVFDQAYWFLFMKLAPKGTMQIQVGGVKMLVDTDDLFVSSLLVRDATYEDFETNVLQRILTPGMTFVDIGAQIGYYSLISRSLVGETGRVYAFEPNASNFNLLSKNIKLNEFRNVLPVRMAVSNHVGSATLYVDSFNKGKHSLAERNVTAIDALGGIQKVETTSLDNYLIARGITRIDVLKIDAEGAEGLVIDGARTLLGADDVTIFMEFWPFGERNIGLDPTVTLKQLAEFGYSCWRIDNNREVLVAVPDPLQFAAVNKPRSSFDLLFRKKSEPHARTIENREKPGN